MTENNTIKSITIHACPHCGKEMFAETHMTPPIVNSLFTMEEVEQAKKDCLERLETLSIEDEKKETVKKWLNDPNTIFSLGEVESIVLSLLKPE